MSARSGPNPCFGSSDDGRRQKLSGIHFKVALEKKIEQICSFSYLSYVRGRFSLIGGAGGDRSSSDSSSCPRPCSKRALEANACLKSVVGDVVAFGAALEQRRRSRPNDACLL